MVNIKTSKRGSASAATIMLVTQVNTSSRTMRGLVSARYARSEALMEDAVRETLVMRCRREVQSDPDKRDCIFFHKLWLEGGSRHQTALSDRAFDRTARLC